MNNLTEEELKQLLQERSKKTLKLFANTSAQGLTNPEVIQMLTRVNRYWNDMLRPTLTSLCCEAVGGGKDAVDDASLMITLISAGMGIHDDIIDRSQTKHFRTTLPGITGPDVSIVIGDLLIVKAITSIRQMTQKIDQTKTNTIISAYEAAFIEMCEGEIMEITCRQSLNIPIKKCKEILWKFGADTEVCAIIGATIGNASVEETAALARYGRQIGYLFRLLAEVKDALNIEGNLGQRLKNESVPLPVIYTAYGSKESFETIKLALKNPEIKESDIETILSLCFKSEAFKYVNKLSSQSAKQAYRMLTVLKPSKANDALKAIVDQYYREIQSLCV